MLIGVLSALKFAKLAESLKIAEYSSLTLVFTVCQSLSFTEKIQDETNLTKLTRIITDCNSTL